MIFVMEAGEHGGNIEVLMKVPKNTAFMQLRCKDVKDPDMYINKSILFNQYQLKNTFFVKKKTTKKKVKLMGK